MKAETLTIGAEMIRRTVKTKSRLNKKQLHSAKIPF
jgi:hypothetical protein